MSSSVSINQDYTIISRWKHKTLVEWRKALEKNGSDILMYEEYIDFTNSKEHFDKFMGLLCEYCPNLTHVRLLFSGEKKDVPEDGLMDAVLRLPNVQCLTLIDAPSIALLELQNDFNQLTTLNLSGIDKSIIKATTSLSDIIGSMKKLNSLVYNYNEGNDKIVEALANLSNLKALTLLYLPRSEFLQLKNCNQLEVLCLYNIYEKISTEEFLDVFTSMRNLHTLSMVFLEQNKHLTQEFYKLNAFCPQLTYLTLNSGLESFGDFANLKYLKIEDEFASIQIDNLLTLLCPTYANRLQILDISGTHLDSKEITKLQSLNAFLCATCPQNMYACFSEFQSLKYLSFEKIANDLSEIANMIASCSELRYLRLLLKVEEVDELIQTLPDLLHRRNFQADDPFVLSLSIGDAVPEIEAKLKIQPHGALLKLDWNGKIFASKLKDLIASLSGSSNKKSSMKTIFQNPCKMAGDCLDLDDRWMSNTNYKLALQSCKNKFSLEYDEELISRCRNMTINNAEYVLPNQIHAFNFKYDAIDCHNEL